MKLTRIEKENEDNFKPLLPEGGIIKDQAGVGALGDDGVPVAAALLSGGEGMVSLDWLFVHPDYRKQGIGREFLFSIQNLFQKEAAFLSVTYVDAIPELESFFENAGFLMTSGDVCYTLPVQTIQKELEKKKVRERSARAEIFSFSELANVRKDAVADFLKKETGTRGFMYSFDPARSFCSFDKEGKAAACLFTEPAEKGVIFVSMLLSTGPIMMGICLFDRLIAALEEAGETDGVLQFLAAGESVERYMGPMLQSFDDISRTELRRAVCLL